MRSPITAPTFEPLESRTLLDAAPDLALTLLSVTAPDPLVPGDRVAIQVQVTNAGTAPAVGAMDLSLRLSTDTTFDLTDPLMGGLTAKKINLAPTRSTTLTLTGIVPSDATPDDYYWLAQVSSTLAVADASTANDVVVSDVTTPVVWQFGNVEARKNVKLTLHDGNGPVVFSLTGPGTGTVNQTSDSFDENTVTVVGSTTASSMTIATGKGLFTTLDSISVVDDAGADTGSIKSITAATTNLESGVTVDGLLSTLSVHDIQSAVHYITLDAADVSVPANATASIKARAINGLTVTTGNLPIKSFTAAQITGLDLTAPWIGSMTVTSKTPGEGNLSGSLLLTAELNEPKVNLGSLTVSGNMDNTTIDVDSSIGAIKAAQWLGGSLTGECKSLTVLGDMSATVDSIYLRSANIGGDLSGTWGGWVGRVTVGGDLTNATLELGPQTHAGAGLTWNQMDSLTVKGWISSTTLSCLNPIGSITAGGMRDSSFMNGVTSLGLPVSQDDFDSAHSGTFASVTIKGIKEDGFYVDSFINSNVAAWQIGKLSFGYVQSDNSGTPFGIAAHILRTMTYRHQAGWSATSTNLTTEDSFSDGDFQVTIV